MSAPTGAWRRMIAISGVRQAPRLVEDVLGDADLAHVVEQRRGFQRLDVCVVGHAQRVRQPHRVLLHTADVIVGDLVLGVDRLCQRLDRGDIDAVHSAEMFDLILRPPDRLTEGDVQDHGQRHDQEHDFERLQRVALPVVREDEHQHRGERGAQIGHPQADEVLAPDRDR